MMLTGWILYAVIAGGVLGVDLTVELEKNLSRSDCEDMAEYMAVESKNNKNLTLEYEFYCVQDPTQKA